MTPELKIPNTWNKPRLYYQQADSAEDSRIRIIYPSGDAEYSRNGYGEEFTAEKTYSPCWAETHGYGPNELGHNNTAELAVLRMNAYDWAKGWASAIFIGEL